MILEFENHLTAVLGHRLQGRYHNRVSVHPGPEPDGEPRILVGVIHVQPLEMDIGTTLPPLTPGAEHPRRVIRLRCQVRLEMILVADQDHADQMAALGTLLYLLDDPELRNGRALIDDDTADPGFVIEELRLIETGAATDQQVEGSVPTVVTLSAGGWFWPVGEPDVPTGPISGIQIGLTVPGVVEELPDLIVGPVEEWVAYNDLYFDDVDPSASNAPNTTGHTYESVSEALVNYETGEPLPVTMTGTIQGGYDPRLTGGDARAGTDAHSTFGGIVSQRGSFELNAPDSQNIITFENLAPNKHYTVELTANRNDGRYTGVRFTRVRIAGAETYTHASSEGVIINSDDSVSFGTGDNRAGLVARWTEITTLDGRFSIVSEWDNTRGGGSPRNTKGYAMSVFKLTQRRTDADP